MLLYLPVFIRDQPVQQAAVWNVRSEHGPTVHVCPANYNRATPYRFLRAAAARVLGRVTGIVAVPSTRRR
jgi:hypothetical protein